jgi:ribose transport system permease protein
MTERTAQPDFTNVGRTAWHRRGFFASQTAYVLGALILIAVVLSFTAPAFLTTGNLVNVTKNFSYIAIVSLGITLVIISGGLDLSVGSVMALTAICTVIFMNALAGTPLAAVPGLTMAAALIGGLLLAAFIGWVNGVLIAYVGLSPFVTTLGMLSICRGLAFVITQGRGQAPSGPDVDLFYALTNGTLFGLPVPILYLLILAAIMAVVLRHTAWGRYVFTLGGNERAAALTGIRVNRVKISVYVLSALSAGFAGILLAGWLGSVPANLAFGYELRIIAAAVIGGANLAGGAGGPLGAIVGAALIEVIRNGLVLSRVNPYWQDTLIGAIIIFAVLIDRLRERRQRSE